MPEVRRMSSSESSNSTHTTVRSPSSRTSARAFEGRCRDRPKNLVSIESCNRVVVIAVDSTTRRMGRSRPIPIRPRPSRNLPENVRSADIFLHFRIRVGVGRVWGGSGEGVGGQPDLERGRALVPGWTPAWSAPCSAISVWRTSRVAWVGAFGLGRRRRTNATTRRGSSGTRDHPKRAGEPVRHGRGRHDRCAEPVERERCEEAHAVDLRLSPQGDVGRCGGTFEYLAQRRAHRRQQQGHLVEVAKRNRVVSGERM